MAEQPLRHVYWVQLLTSKGGEPRHFGFAFESSLPDVAAVRDELKTAGIVCGAKLDLVDDGRGGRMIRGSSGIGFGTAGLVSIQDYLKPVWEPEA